MKRLWYIIFTPENVREIKDLSENSLVGAFMKRLEMSLKHRLKQAETPPETGLEQG